MAMSVGGDSSGDAPMSDINTTPLVDVMLVLLIIFLITVPVVTQTVQLKLPKVQFEPTITKPENVALSVRERNGTCEVYWGMSRIASDALFKKARDKLIAEIARQGGAGTPGLELPEVHIRGDVDTPYHCIGATIITMQRAGFVKVGFISEPEPGASVQRL